MQSTCLVKTKLKLKLSMLRYGSSVRGKIKELAKEANMCCLHAHRHIKREKSVPHLCRVVLVLEMEMFSLKVTVLTMF